MKVLVLLTALGIRRLTCYLILSKGSLLATNIPDTTSNLVMLAANSQNMTVELGIITDSSIHPGFAVPTRREDSFLTWPVENKKLAAEMSECMLFYSGMGLDRDHGQ